MSTEMAIEPFRSRPTTSDTGVPAIAVTHLTKSYGALNAVDDLTFTVERGRVTGFLGPNGAGKTTTLRMLLGLVEPTAGTATIGGTRYVDLDRPVTVVGAVLEASSAHRGRTGLNHLKCVCMAAGIPLARASEVLEQVGLGPAAGRPFRGYSLGMRQRLGIATALLGDPAVLILDEPTNGLDPAGIRWMRNLLRELARDGRTVLVSSHLLSEMQYLADDVVIIASGRVVYQGSTHQLRGAITTVPSIDVRTPDPSALARLLVAAGGRALIHPDGTIQVHGLTATSIGDLALAKNLPVHHLASTTADLEDAYLQLTEGKAGIR